MLAHLSRKILKNPLSYLIAFHALDPEKCCHSSTAGIVITIFYDSIVQILKLFVLGIGYSHNDYLNRVVWKLYNHFFGIFYISNRPSNQHQYDAVNLASLFDFILYWYQSWSKIRFIWELYFASRRLIMSYKTICTNWFWTVSINVNWERFSWIVLNGRVNL